MDVLRCKTPSMVRKEIYVYLLAYNLLRSLSRSAGTAYCAPPLRLSIHRHSSSFNQFYSQFIICFSGVTTFHNNMAHPDTTQTSHFSNKLPIRGCAMLLRDSVGPDTVDVLSSHSGLQLFHNNKGYS